MKNFTAYKLPNDYKFEVNHDQLEDHLFTSCQALDFSRIGFVNNTFGELVTSIPQGLLLTIRKQEKKPKLSHINHLIREGKQRILEEEGRVASRKEVSLLKDEATFTVLPKTFPDEPVDVKIIVTHDNWVYCDAPSKKAEDCLSLLREAVGSLPCVFIEVDKVNDKLTDLIKGPLIGEWAGTEYPFCLGSKIGIIDPDGRKVKISGGDILGSDATDILNNGGLVEEVMLNYQNCVDFTLKDSLELCNVKFDSEFLEETSEDNAACFMLQFHHLREAYHRVLTTLDYKQGD